MQGRRAYGWGDRRNADDGSHGKTAPKLFTRFSYANQFAQSHAERRSQIVSNVDSNSSHNFVEATLMTDFAKCAQALSDTLNSIEAFSIFSRPV